MTELQASATYGAAGWAGGVAGGIVGFKLGGPFGAGVFAYYGRLYGILFAWKAAEFVSPGQPKPVSPEVLFPWLVPVEPVGVGSGLENLGSVERSYVPSAVPWIDDVPVEGSTSGGGGTGSGGPSGGGGLTFSIAISFGGATW
jgi:hypothetical protein